MKHHSVHSQLVKTSYGEEYPVIQEPQGGGTYSLYFEAPSAAITQEPYTGLTLEEVTGYIEQVVYHNPEKFCKVTIVNEDDDAGNPPAGGAAATKPESGQLPMMTDAYAPAFEEEQNQRTI